LKSHLFVMCVGNHLLSQTREKKERTNPGDRKRETKGDNSKKGLKDNPNVIKKGRSMA